MCLTCLPACVLPGCRDAATGVCRATLEGHSGAVFAVAVAASGGKKTAVSGGYDAKVCRC